MVELGVLGSLIGVMGCAAFVCFGREKFPKTSRAVATLMLVGINVFFVVFTAKVWRETDSPTLGVMMLGCWFILQKYCHDTTAPPRHHRWVIVMERRATELEESAFKPDRYFRFKRNRSWRGLELEIDDAIDIPDAEIIAVAELGGGVFQNVAGTYVQVGGWISVYFEYKDELFYGAMRL